MKWISIVEQDLTHLKPRKTKIWLVYTQYGATTMVLGEIRWFAKWRKYCFFSTSDTVFEWTCLNDISEFIKKETKIYKDENWVK